MLTRRSIFANGLALSAGLLAGSVLPANSAYSEPSQDLDPSQDDDHPAIQTETRKEGSYDLGFSESMSCQVNWTYTNSKGILFSMPLLQSGQSLTHPKNDKLTWYFDAKDSFDSSDLTSQVNDKLLIFTRRDESHDLVSWAIAKRHEKTLELVGLVTVEQLLNDKKFPLPAVNAHDDTMVLQSAIENFYPQDVFTCVLLSRRLYVVVAIDHMGMPRVLYYIDRKDANKSVIDPKHPHILLAEDMTVSFPKYNLTNNHDYAVMMQSPKSGMHLFHITRDGLKLALTLSDGKNDENPPDFVTFPKQNYTWQVHVQSKESDCADTFLQAIYNVGADKETVLHWRLRDGHHAFVAIHQSDVSQYEVLPRALLKANEPVHADSNWTLKPYSQVNTAVSPTHGDAEDKLLMWNHVDGCVFLSFVPDAKESAQYDIRLLRHMTLDEGFDTDGTIRLNVGDSFFYPNHSLTPQRRFDRARLYSMTKKVQNFSLFSQNASEDQDTLYRVHFYSRTNKKAYSMDFTERCSHELQSEDSAVKKIHFSSISNGIVSSPENLPDKKEKLPTDPPKADKAAEIFWTDFVQNFVSTGLAPKPPYQSVDDNIVLQEQSALCCGSYRSHFQVDESWCADFRTSVADLASQEIPGDDDNGEVNRSAAVWRSVAFAGIPVMAGALGLAYAQESNSISSLLAQHSMNKNNCPLLVPWSPDHSYISPDHKENLRFKNSIRQKLGDLKIQYGENKELVNLIDKTSSFIEQLETKKPTISSLNEALKAYDSFVLEAKTILPSETHTVFLESEAMSTFRSTLKQFSSNSAEFCGAGRTLYGCFFVMGCAALAGFF